MQAIAFSQDSNSIWQFLVLGQKGNEEVYASAPDMDKAKVTTKEMEDRGWTVRIVDIESRPVQEVYATSA